MREMRVIDGPTDPHNVFYKSQDVVCIKQQMMRVPWVHRWVALGWVSGGLARLKIGKWVNSRTVSNLHRTTNDAGLLGLSIERSSVTTTVLISISLNSIYFPFPRVSRIPPEEIDFFENYIFICSLRATKGLIIRLAADGNFPPARRGWQQHVHHRLVKKNLAGCHLIQNQSRHDPVHSSCPPCSLSALHSARCRQINRSSMKLNLI